MRSLSFVVAAAGAVAIFLAGCGTGTSTGSVSDSLAYLGSAEDCSKEGKVLICHVPPGNPANAHNICVGEPAVKAHQKNHGDQRGACPSDAGTEPSQPGGVEEGGGDENASPADAGTTEPPPIN